MVKWPKILGVALLPPACCCPPRTGARADVGYLGYSVRPAWEAADTVDTAA